MMGRLSGDQDRSFYEFNLDEVVPAEHLARRIDGVLDLSWLHGEAMSLSLLKFAGQASLVDEAMLPS